MKKVLKIVMIGLMLVGIALSVANVVSAESTVNSPPSKATGTMTLEGDCLGDPLNC